MSPIVPLYVIKTIKIGTMARDKPSHYANSGSSAAGLLETKVLINSTISKKGTRFFTADLKDHFLASPMDRSDYMKVPLHRFPPNIIKRYKLDQLVSDDGYAYIKINVECMDYGRLPFLHTIISSRSLNHTVTIHVNIA